MESAAEYWERTLADGEWAACEVAIADIDYDPTYQDPARHSWPRVQRIHDKWSDGQCGAIKLAVYGGQIWCVTGWHRTNAAEKKFGREHRMRAVLGKITRQEAARLYAVEDQNTVRVQSALKIRALIEAGDEAALLFRSITADHGWDLAFNGVATRNKIGCVAQAWKLYDKRGGPAILKRTLDVATRSWGYSPSTVHINIMGGLGFFVSRYWDFTSPTVDWQHLVDVLRRISPDELKGKMAGKYRAMLPARGEQFRAEAMVIKRLYQARLDEKNRLPADDLGPN